MNTIKLGVNVRDRITGFEGVVTGRCEYISGCDQALIAHRVKDDGSAVDSQWFDIQRLEVLAGSVIELDNRATPGADRPAPKR